MTRPSDAASLTCQVADCEYAARPGSPYCLEHTVNAAPVASADAAWNELTVEAAVTTPLMYQHWQDLVDKHRPAIEAAIRGREGLDRKTLDRLMELWQEPWSEPAYGEAQMLLARLARTTEEPT